VSPVPSDALLQHLLTLFDEANRPRLGRRRREELRETFARTLNERDEKYLPVAQLAEAAQRLLGVGGRASPEYTGGVRTEGTKTDGAGYVEYQMDGIDAFGALPLGSEYGALSNAFAIAGVDEKVALLFWDTALYGVGPVSLSIALLAHFRLACRRWEKGRPFDTQGFMNDANDLLNGIEFPGRFVAAIAGLVDPRERTFRASHAGMRDFRVVRADSRSVELVRQQAAPVLGPFPTDLIAMQPALINGFPAAEYQLSGGDTLLFISDGLEQTRRSCQPPPAGDAWREPSGAQTRIHRVESYGNEPGGTYEQFGNGRIDAILNAVASGSAYRMGRYGNPDPDEELLFDFSKAEPRPRAPVLALLACELVFRLIPDPDAGPDDVLRVDREVAEFLREVFSGYDRYFSHPVEPEQDDVDIDAAPWPEDSDAPPSSDATGSPSPQVVFTHVRADEGWDDICILAVQVTGSGEGAAAGEAAGETIVAEEPSGETARDPEPDSRLGEPVEVETLDAADDDLGTLEPVDLEDNPDDEDLPELYGPDEEPGDKTP
jgi:hypothetical protein